MKVSRLIHAKFRREVETMAKRYVEWGRMTAEAYSTFESRWLSYHMADLVRRAGFASTEQDKLEAAIIYQAVADTLGWFTMTFVGAMDVDDEKAKEELKCNPPR